MPPGSAVVVGGARLALVLGDITEQAVDAIVNAANPSLLGGGGVDGAIHRRGGPSILEECVRIREERHPDGLPRGAAVATTAGALPARGVIHTAGPIWAGGRAGEGEVLASSYTSCLAVAAERGWRTIAFPSISTGVYGYPIEAAAAVALEAIRGCLLRRPGTFGEVRMVLFSAGDLTVYRDALAALPISSPGGATPS